MPLIVPLRDGLPFFDLQAVLDGVTYTLTLRWNPRASLWFLDVSNVDGTTQYQSGVGLVVSFPLGAYTTGRSPPGALVVVDTSGANEDPQLEGLATRWQLLYFSAAELGLG